MKKKRIVWLMLSCLMAVALVLASCTPAAVEEEEGKTVVGEVTEKEGAPAVEEEEEEEEVVEVGREMVTDPSTGKLVTAPEYGGTIILGDYQDRGEGADRCYDINSSRFLNSGVVESLAMSDWAIDRDIYDFATGTIEPSLMVGCLAESWETPDATTTVFHIRQGVHWHNKPPMNGRELTAYDIEYNFHRYLGMGQFSECEPCYAVYRLGDMLWESIEATDKWTVVFKLTEPNMWALDEVLNAEGASLIYPPEVIDLYGDAKDWRNQVGTGPFMLTDFVEGSSTTFTKNPNYWGYDEKYPQNRLPYVDELRVLVLPDESTRLAALRSGKIDLALTFISNVDVADSLKKTNPEIVQYSFRSPSLNSYFANQDISALSDVNVRAAMQMAIDLETINDLYYRGQGFPEPMGPLGTLGWYIPFDEWPEGVKQEYTYDPAGAEALLDAAGYPRGADGIRFKTEMNLSDGSDQSYSELVISYWRAIGIDTELEVTPGAEYFMGVVVEKDFHHILWEAGNLVFEECLVTKFHSDHDLWWAVSFKMNDAAYDLIMEDLLAATTLDEYKRLAREADWYAIENHWQGWGVGAPTVQVANPWLKGWNGERSWARTNDIVARLWIDHEMKKAMGH